MCAQLCAGAHSTPLPCHRVVPIFIGRGAPFLKCAIAAKMRRFSDAKRQAVNCDDGARIRYTVTVIPAPKPLLSPPTQFRDASAAPDKPTAAPATRSTEETMSQQVGARGN